MYSTVGLLRHAKKADNLGGTHQRLDKIARRAFSEVLSREASFRDEDFPSYKEIIHFEGYNGPDGLKWKSPGIDEPMHFIIPDHDDGKVIKMILDHQYNLNHALKSDNRTRAAFEAAWMAHAITDGLTPAHHFPYEEAVSELMSDKEYFKIFGKPVKGIMRGNTVAQTARNNWIYLGPEGYMTKHIAFEYGAGLIASSTPMKALTPKITSADLDNLDLKHEFYDAFRRIVDLDMYSRYRYKGWTKALATESKAVLIPEIVRLIVLGWYSALPKTVDKQPLQKPAKTNSPRARKDSKNA